MRRRNPILRVRRLTVRPGETVVLEVAADVTHEYATRLKVAWAKRFPDVPCVVLAGARLAGVLATDEATVEATVDTSGDAA